MGDTVPLVLDHIPLLCYRPLKPLEKVLLKLLLTISIEKLGISILGETVGRMAGNNHRNLRGARDDEQKIKGYRGIVSIVDIQLLLDNQDEPIKNSIVAHWVAHPQPVASCAFNPSGNVLITADISGREFHVFSIHVHPVSSCDSAVHHLYTLQRGDTTAQVNFKSAFFILNLEAYD